MALALSGMMWLRCSVVSFFEFQLLDCEHGETCRKVRTEGSRVQEKREVVVVGLVEITRHASMSRRVCSGRNL